MPLMDPIAFRAIPPPSGDHPDRPLDLHRWLVRRSHSTFLMRSGDDRLGHLGILRDDVLVIDRGATPRADDLVVVIRNDELVLMSLPKHRDGPPIDLWGTVVGLARRMRAGPSAPAERERP